MFLASYEMSGKSSWGAVDREKNIIYDKSVALGEDAPDTLRGYIALSGCGKFEKIDLSSLKDGIDINDVTLLSPIPNPLRNVFCVGKNYLDHINELSEYDIKQFSPDAELPIFFTKATTCVNSPYGDVSLHQGVTEQVDYEAELAVIIGKEGCSIKASQAYNYIFGYTVLNDFTARDLQKNHKQWLKGKSLDGYCPMGPWIATCDEIEDPQALNIASYVNGEMRQSSNTELMIFKIARLIEDLSKGMTFLPGDILATGTPSGVGAGFKPPRFLKKGDKVKVTVEAIGEIENEIV